ncbi:MAG: HAD-IC family P-type ATPase [Anaerolineales bacterium]|nr:HAD-IC family P-type ATPase [Anaerolineales bacterium]
MMTATKETDYARWEEPDPPEKTMDVEAIPPDLPDDAYHALSPAHVAARLGTDLEAGLAETAVSQRQEQYGANTLQVSQRTPWYVVLGRQFIDVLIFVLFIAAIISAALGEMVDAIAIVAIMLLNGVLGFVQEWKAEQAIEALQQMLAPRCRAVRSGHEREIGADELVPGDVVLLTIGDRVPADVRLVRSFDLKIDESSLTGESVPVNKGAEAVALDAPLAERPSMAWMGTAVTNGHGRGIVVATGMETEFGRIAQMTQTVQEEVSPLQRQLGVLGKQLAVIAIGISILVSIVGWLTGKPLLDMFLTGVSLAVAAVPEGLPAVVTLTLALGIRAMVRRRALLRRLQAAETLGSTTLICTDKTGTLTQNEMTVQQI